MHILLKIGLVSLVLIVIATAITLPIVVHFLRQNKDTAISSNETTTAAAASHTTLMTSSQEHGTVMILIGINNSTSVTANMGLNITAVTDDDEGGNHQFLFDVHVQAKTTVTLVITTYTPNTVGVFSIIVTGPIPVQFLQPNITAPRLPLPSPANLVAFRGTNQTLIFGVIGSASESIWGTTIYTDDSPTAVTSVHSGFVRVGQRCAVTFMILPGQDKYISTTQHGITSKSWTAWVGSYTIIQSTCFD
ncbi:unnamed protein product [Adineta ricciae]|uniref:LCCL domain-containing protein n=1 Tax=Adineta ricciae TaxID=249248 RepID=A0A815C253_ADIRI|nr:unnamed protein product [Adineta ricciae]